MKSLFLVLILLISNNYLSAQNFRVKVSKIKRIQDYDGYSLKLEVKKNGHTKKIVPGNYSTSYSFLSYYSIDEKIIILEELAKYLSDFSLCSDKVSKHFLTTRIQGVESVQSKQYPVAIQAMFLMNFMAFSEASMYLAKYPVLFNTCSGKEVGIEDHANITKMTQLYNTWISNVKLKRKISYYDILDFYRGEVIWVDMLNMPSAREIITDIGRYGE